MKKKFFLCLLIFCGFIKVDAIARPGNGKVRTDSIYSLEQITLGGLPQTVLITGSDLQKPVLLFVHGGPGFSEMALVRKYNRDLDKSYIVVSWDQRGTNLSYSPNTPRSSMTMDQIVSDGHELVQLLKKRFKKSKIFLLGHSWGSAVGVIMASRYPEDFYAYIGVGQVAGMQDNERVSTQFALDMAKQDHNQAAIEEIHGIMPYPAPANTLSQLYVSRKWMQYYGGEVFGYHDSKTTFKGISTGNNSLYDTSRAEIGTTFSMESLWGPFLQTDLPRTVPELRMPVFFILGRHDYNVPFKLAQDYLEQLRAPAKKLFMFEHSAHLPCFEEPEKFNEVLSQISAIVKATD